MALHTQPTVSMIVACTWRLGIGFHGALPWPSHAFRDDMIRFKELTSQMPDSDTDDPGAGTCTGTGAGIGTGTGAGTGAGIGVEKRNALLMGRRTWESLPQIFREKPGKRHHAVVSNTPEFVQSIRKRQLEGYQNVSVHASLKEAFDNLRKRGDIYKIFVIGGSRMFREAMENTECSTIHATHILKPDFQCDTFMPPIDQKKFQVQRQGEIITRAMKDGKGIEDEQHVSYQFVDYERRHEECQYLDLVRDVLDIGQLKQDRTGTGTLSLFGRTMRFNLRGNKLPLLTTKRLFWRGIVEELLWMIRGQTDAQQLAEKGVHIWDANASREFLDQLGFQDREEGDLGPIYGFQWRHFGAEYKTCKDDYTGKGVDQLAEVIEKIKTKPFDRRIIVNAYNVADLKKMNLPPCHSMFQFNVNGDELSCLMFQRSGDLGLGIPFNIAFYSLLTHLVAAITGKHATEFVHVIGDAHVYLNHIDPLHEQLKRVPTNEFPSIKIHKKIVSLADVEALQFSDIELIAYRPQGTIKMAMSA